MDAYFEDGLHVMQTSVGASGAERVETVDASHIRAFRRAVGWADVKDADLCAPITFVCALRGLLPLPDLGPGWTSLNAGNEFRPVRPIRPGEVVHAVARLREASVVEGRSGQSVKLVRTDEFRDETGALIASMHGVAFRRFKG